MDENQPKISIIIIHYNTPQYLESCLNAILAQTYKNIEIIFIDNNSPDKSGLKLVRDKYGYLKNLKIVANEENLGYAKAGNQGIRMALRQFGAQPEPQRAEQAEAPFPSITPSDYVVITNPDIIYTTTYFEKIVARMEQDKKIAAITGKVYKYDFDRMQETNIIDTVGLFAYKNRRVIDDGQGIIDEGQFDEECEVFGVSGACPLYRREALEDVKILDEYLDEDFFMYKEDVDISWRFLLYGWKNLYYPKAVAYHGRGTGIYRRFFNREILENRKRLSKFQKHYSFKNQYLMETKNKLWGNTFINIIPIIFKKLATTLYISVREPYLWKSYIAYLRQLPRALAKRKIIMEKKKISAGEMEKWFQKQSKYIAKAPSPKFQKSSLG